MDKIKDKKVLIFGLGLNQGGVGAARFFAKNGAKIRVTDLKSKGVLQSSIDELKEFPGIEYTLGEHKYKDIDWAELIIKNPAVKPGNKYIDYAIKNGKKVETDMGIFLQHVKPGQIIGVTGTKGKSTVASLIYEILKQVQDDKIVFAGNIGKSVLDALEFIKSDTLVILEISSFQLEAFELKKISPKWAIITNTYPDHLNYYSSIEEYVNAKKIIAKYQTKDDFLFIRKNDPAVDTEEFLDGIKSQIIRFSTDDLPKDFHPILSGQHNLENIAAAYSVSKILAVPESEVLRALSSFKGVEFRMQLVKEWHGVKIYNDTTATGPDPAIAALRTLPGSIVIAGGMNKGMSYDEYAKVLSKNAKAVYLLAGDSTDAILSSLQAQGSRLEIHGPYSNLVDLLNDVRDVAKPGDTILFSPAATSFNLFQNEFDRGRKFNEAVEEIFK